MSEKKPKQKKKKFERKKTTQEELFKLPPPTLGEPTVTVQKSRKIKFKPEFCDQLIAHMERGYTYRSFAGLIGVGETTLYKWERDDQPGWKEAKNIAQARSRLWLESQGLDGMWFEEGKRNLNFNMYRLHMQARFPNEWRIQSDLNIKAQIDHDVKKLHDLPTSELLQIAKTAVEYLDAEVIYEEEEGSSQDIHERRESDPESETSAT